VLYEVDEQVFQRLHWGVGGKHIQLRIFKILRQRCTHPVQHVQPAARFQAAGNLLQGAHRLVHLV